MPIPKKRATESKNEFIGRCISELTDEYGKRQAAAVCYNQLRAINEQKTE